MKILNQHVVSIGVAALAVAGIVWYVLSGSQSSVSAPPAVVDTATADQDVIATLLSLRATRLDSQIFSDPVFLTLSDFSTTIVPEPVGRSYPFAPLGADAPTSVSVKPVAPAQNTPQQPARSTQQPASTPKPPAPSQSQSQSAPSSGQSQTPAPQQTAPVQDPKFCNQHQTYDACVACAQRRGFPPEQYQPYCADLQQ